MDYQEQLDPPVETDSQDDEEEEEENVEEEEKEDSVDELALQTSTGTGKRKRSVPDYRDSNPQGGRNTESLDN